MRTALLLALLLAAGGCRGDADSARGVAERFLDQRYVLMNLKGAHQYTTGLARDKVEEELRLIGDQVVDESTQRPKVSYELSEERPEGDDRATLVYRADVRMAGGDSFPMRWLLNMKREDGAWRVSNFKEFQ